MATENVIMRPAALQEFARSEPVVAYMLRGADRVAAAARAQIRLGYVRGGGQHALQQGSRPAHINLRDTVVKRVLNVGGLPVVRIGSDSPHARFVHEGTRPHIIRPVNGEFLVFPGATAAGPNGLVFAKIVHHPGTKPNHYLTENLHLAVQ